MDKTRDRITEAMRQAIADNLRIDADRIRYARGDGPGQFGESGMRWEIFYRDQWRELPWHFDGPQCVTRDLVRRWYG
ncbi:MAG: hypothetical protein KDB00_23000 [Planctomycetales bacterium]|nr:hypothetical protein [Planctomycetales bacterium]